MLEWLPNSPLISFTILLLVILTVPPIFERLRLPGLVGLLFAGVVLGSDGLGLLDPDSETTKLLSDIGKIYLMFVAGLEVDLNEFRKTKDRSIGFGLATFLLPLAVGTVIGQVFGFGLNASILIGSLLASHTLLGYPIVQRLGVVRNEAVTVTIGATIFTDIASLLVLAICVAIHAGEFSAGTLVLQLLMLAIYAAAVLFGLDWAGKNYFRRTGDEESNQFLFVLLAVFLASMGAQLINVDKIVGAFLAGLAVNDVVGRGPVEEKIEFVGSTLFIPCFFVGMGLLLDVPAFIESLTTNFGLTAAIAVGLFASKFIAAAVFKFIFRYQWYESLTMWSLSLPQVAATLAAALAGLSAGIIDESVFNSIIVLMLLTSLAGPMLTERFAVRLAVPKAASPLDQPQRESWWGELSETEIQITQPDRYPFTVVVPVYNPHTERNLIELAALLAHHESGTVIPLSIVKAHVHMDEPELTGTLKRSQKLLERAVDISQTFSADARPDIRIDDDVAEGISRTARETNASLIVMGWSGSGLRSRLFGSVTDNVFWASHCPVAVTRLLDEPIHFKQILVPIKNITAQTLRILRFAQLFADTNQASLLILHVHDPRTLPEHVSALEQGVHQAMQAQGPAVDFAVKAIPSDHPGQTILKIAETFDLVILRSTRRRTAGGLAVSDVTTQVIEELSCSIILFGEPHT